MAKQIEDKSTFEMFEGPKRGRPATGHALSAAERQRISRARRKYISERGKGKQVSMMLGPEASMALERLASSHNLDFKATIEAALISCVSHLDGGVLAEQFKKFSV